MVDTSHNLAPFLAVASARVRSRREFDPDTDQLGVVAAAAVANASDSCSAYFVGHSMVDHRHQCNSVRHYLKGAKEALSKNSSKT